MIIRELFAKLGLDIDKGSFTAADVLLAGVKTGLVALGGLAVAAAGGLGVMVHDLVETASTLNDTSIALGINTDALQEIGFAAKLGGSGIEEMRGGLAILNKHLTAAKDGNEESQKAFAKLHIKIRDTNGALKTTDVVLGDVADALAKLPEGPERTARAMDLFGRSGASLLPVLSEGREGLQKLRQEARDLGLVINAETIKAGDDLGDNLDRLKLSIKGVEHEIAGAFLGEINHATEAVIEWVKANRMLIAQRIEKVIRALLPIVKLFVQALGVLWRVLGLVIDNWKLLAVILGSIVLAAIVANIGAITTLIGQYIWLGIASLSAAIKSAAAWLAAAAPIILLSALIAIAILLFEDWITGMEGGDSILGELWPKWKKFLQDFASGGSEDEPLWLQFLRFGAALLSDFDKTFKEVIAGWKLIFQDFGNWVLSILEQISGYLASKIRGSIDSIRSLLHLNSTDSPIGGGGSSPTASVNARPAGGNRTVQQTNAPVVNIYQREGESSVDLAGRFREQLDDYNQAQLDQTLAALNG
jgi:hypothetical protein